MARVPQVFGRYPDAPELDRAWCELGKRAGARASIAGHSFEGRPIHRYDFGDEGAPTVLLTSLLHGVEVISALALHRAVETMADRFSKRLRLVVLPVLNPDAFASNMQRLTEGRRAYQRCNARGVDLNRNFARMPGARSLHPFAGSRFRFSPHYTGAHPFSEPESCVVREVATEIRPSLSLGFHSIGNLVLYPWSYTRDENPRVGRYRALASSFIENVRGPRYRARQAIDLYPVIGDMDDWLDSHFGTLAFTVEVSRPTSAILHPRRVTNPFCWMNPSDVEPVVQGIVPGVIAMLESFAEGPAVEDPAPAHRPFGIEVAAR